jgi:UrcA family protein
MRAFALALPVAIAFAATAVAGPITAVAPQQARHGWLAIEQVDAAGNYAARIRLGDLDLTSAGGYAAAQARIGHASADLCAALADDTEMPGVAATNVRACRADLALDMTQRLEKVRAEVAAGKLAPSLATL